MIANYRRVQNEEYKEKRKKYKTIQGYEVQSLQGYTAV
jgi:hypothetical protein